MAGHYVMRLQLQSYNNPNSNTIVMALYRSNCPFLDVVQSSGTIHKYIWFDLIDSYTEAGVAHADLLSSYM